MKKLLFTGGTGFLGKNVISLLQSEYKVTTCGITSDDMIQANLAKLVPELPERYDVVLHAAGKAHVVPKTEEEIKQFFDINYQGTVNLCVGLEKVGIPKALIFVSTVAVYGLDYGSNITEDTPLKGDTPYAKSKIMAEEYLTEWCNKHNVILGIIRPSLIAGPNPPGNLGAMINGIKTGRYLSINRGNACKSVLMVQDIAKLVPLLAEKGGVYNVCDTHHPSFGELESLIAEQLGKRKPISIPLWIANILAKCGDLLGRKAPINSMKLAKIVKPLTFSNDKVRNELGWEPTSVLDSFRIE